MHAHCSFIFNSGNLPRESTGALHSFRNELIKYTTALFEAYVERRLHIEIQTIAQGIDDYDEFEDETSEEDQLKYLATFCRADTTGCCLLYLHSKFSKALKEYQQHIHHAKVHVAAQTQVP